MSTGAKVLLVEIRNSASVGPVLLRRVVHVPQPFRIGLSYTLRSCGHEMRRKRLT